MNEIELVEVAERLEGSMSELTGALQAERQTRQQESAELRTYGQRTRRMTWFLVVSILFSLGMGVVAVTASVQAKQATSQAHLNAQNAKITCVTGNESRKLQTQLWTYVLDLASKNPDLTAYQKKQIAAFKGYIATVYAPRDCDKTPTIPPGTVTPSR